tara:strand:+ start:962 stop:1456 length:495 start_codon:yes stop_codon:yes gene_type:complete
MKDKSLTVFKKDKANKKIYIQHNFSASLNIVWSAFTESEILDRWWAPKPWIAQTEKMEFSEGGYWLYVMIGPKGDKHWGRTDYKTITPQKDFTALDAFCNSNGELIQDLPQNHWKTSFSEESNSTIVNFELTFNTLDDLERLIEMGMKEGFIAALDNLDCILEE